MGWFAKVTSSLFPASDKQELESETKELSSTVAEDRKIIAAAPPVVKLSGKETTPTSTISPLASRILEKAKQAQKMPQDTDETGKLISPADLFLKTDEAKGEVEKIKNKVLEQNRKETNKFTQASHPKPETQFNAFMKQAEKKNPPSS